MFRFISYFLIAFVFVLVSCTQQVKEFSVHEKEAKSIQFGTIKNNQLARELHQFFVQRYKSNRFNGCVLIAKGGHIVYNKAFGYADFKEKTKLKTSNSFQLASVSKPITGLGILILADKGLLSLDDSVQKFIPEFPYHGITITDLLSHYSGLSNYMYYCDELWDSKANGSISNEEVLGIMSKNTPKPYLKPRIKYNYCNTNYIILASIIERITGVSYKEFIEKEIFERAGMKDSFVLQKELDWRHYPTDVKGYSSRHRLIPLSYLDGTIGDKGIYASTEDLFKLDQLLYTQLLVSDKNLNLAFEPLHKELFQCDNYGLGWRINNSNPERKVVHHTGWWKGFRTHFIRVLPNEATIIVLTNTLSSTIGTDELLSLVGYDEEKVYWPEEKSPQVSKDTLSN